MATPPARLKPCAGCAHLRKMRTGYRCAWPLTQGHRTYGHRDAVSGQPYDEFVHADGRGERWPPLLPLVQNVRSPLPPVPGTRDRYRGRCGPERRLYAPGWRERLGRWIAGRLERAGLRLL